MLVIKEQRKKSEYQGGNNMNPKNPSSETMEDLAYSKKTNQVMILDYTFLEDSCKIKRFRFFIGSKN